MSGIMATCVGCGNHVPHSHLHDQAHGIAGTHMAGSERFVCSVCGHTTTRDAERNPAFVFVLDEPPAKVVP